MESVLNSSENFYDYVIIGGGIVGASTAWQLQQRCPDKRIVLVEKETQLAQHQTGRNSGVIHAGVYYRPGSLKSQFCRQGALDTMAFCRQHDIEFDQCGKLLVATNSLEYERMLTLYQRCLENALAVELLDADQLREREPNITGLGAIFAKDTGIVDYAEVSAKIVALFQALGGQVRLNCEVLDITESQAQVTLDVNCAGSKETLRAGFLVACAGLMADRVARMQGLEIGFRIVPFRGEYFQLPAKYNTRVQHLIYPIPDPELPFLGVHLTRMIDGSVTVGPNAVQGWKREGYGAFNFSWRDSWELLMFKGFWRLLRANARAGIGELKNSWWRRGYLALVQKYCPEVKLEDLRPYPVGVRAQAVLDDGSLVHDFLFVQSHRSLHVCNAPSPAATSALPIGRYLCDKLLATTS